MSGDYDVCYIALERFSSELNSPRCPMVGECGHSFTKDISLKIATKESLLTATKELEGTARQGINCQRGLAFSWELLVSGLSFSILSKGAVILEKVGPSFLNDSTAF